MGNENVLLTLRLIVSELLRMGSMLCMLAHEKRVWNVGAWEAQDAISYTVQVSYLICIFVIEDMNLICIIL
jgi:hypothetical protein